MSGSAVPATGSIASSAVWRVCARVASSVLFGVTLLLLARISPVAEFGQFMVAGALATITGIVLGFGAPSRVLRSAAEPQGAGVVRALFLLTVGIAAVATVAAVTAATVWGLGATVFAGIAWGAGDVVQTYAQNHFAGTGRHRGASWLVGTQRLAPFTVVVAAVATGQDADYGALTVGFAVTALIGAVAPVPLIGGVRGDFRVVLRGATRWWSFSLSTIFGQLQAPVVAAAASTTVAGLYGMASRVIGPILLLPAALATVIIPELARRVGTPELWQLQRKFTRICAIYAVVAMGCAWPVATVVILIVGPHYSAAKVVVAGMVVAAGLSACTQSLAALLIAVGRPGGATASIAGGGAVALILLAIVGGRGSMPLLASVVVIAEVLVLIGVMVAVRRYRHSQRVAG